MEESEKRKERLEAMRIEAQSGNCNESCSQNLENPLIDSPSVLPEVYTRPRFDYYTDPMAAFSANKKKNNNVSPQVSQSCYNPPPGPRNPDSPNYPARGNYSLGQRSQSQGGHHIFSPLGNPGGNSPFGVPPRSSPNAGSRFGTPNNYIPPNFSTGGNFANLGIHRGGRPQFPYGQGRGQPGSGYPGETSPFGTPQSNSPNPWGGSFNTPNNYIPPNSSTGGNFASPGIHRGGRPGSHYGPGRCQPGSGYRGSPYQGRGSGYRDSGRGRGRGVGSHGHTSAESRPDLYYDRSMVEDPWKQASKGQNQKATTPKLNQKANASVSTPKLIRASSFDRSWEENVAESVANELVLQMHSLSVSSSKGGPLQVLSSQMKLTGKNPRNQNYLNLVVLKRKRQGRHKMRKI